VAQAPSRVLKADKHPLVAQITQIFRQRLSKDANHSEWMDFTML
jgi:hypothetical protein